MEALRDKMLYIKKLNSNDMLKAIINDNLVRKYIIELNQEHQLHDENVFSDGTLTPYYSPFTYALKKNKFGDFPKRMVFLETGDFWKTFKIKFGAKDFTITANPNKGEDNLFKKYSPNIVGLTEESVEMLSEYLKPLLQEALWKYINQ